MLVVPAAVAAFVYFPDTNYDRLFPLGTALLMSGAAYALQHQRIDEVVNKGGARKSFWKLAGVILTSLSVMLLGLVVVMAVFDIQLV